MKKVDFKAVKSEIAKLNPSKQELAMNLLDKAEFMASELAKLQEIIKVKGWTEPYKNGANQHGLKKSSEGDIYNTLIKNYISTMKQLNDILPAQDEAHDALIDFLGGE